MPAIPVYSASPINASKASGVTPRTAQPDENAATAVKATTTTATSQQGYPAAQPGARPSLPATTGTAQPFSSIKPTPTQSIYGANPPAPQPGAVPVPPGQSKTIPPPPKAGETLRQRHQPPPPGTTAAPMPPQMSYQSPDPTYPAKSGSSTTAAYTTSTIPLATPLQGYQTDGSLSHPPGYYQNTSAADLSSHQRAANQGFEPQPSSRFSSDEGDGQGVWSAAKKWAAAAGDSLATAENEVWKRINKD